MSLINKMLQDLEGRRSENEVLGAMEGQIRAAPEKRQIHVAWWIVLGLTLILTGVISWLWGYRTAPVAAAEHAPQLALKLAPAIQMPQVPARQMQVPETDRTGLNAESSSSITGESGIAKTPNAIASTPAKREAAIIAEQPVPVQAPAASAPISVQVSAPVAPPVPSREPSAAQAKATEPVLVPPAKSATAERQVQKFEKETAFDIPANVAKQMKEITPQQRAEEEYRRATALLGQGRNRDATAALEKSLQLDPQHSVARQTLAGLLLEDKRHDDAIGILQDGLKADKNYPALAMMLARLQVDKGDLRPAVETLQHTLPHAIDRADYQAFLAALLQREGRHKEAIEHYFVALRKSPQNGLWWMGIAISMQADNRVGDARDAFGRAKASSSLSPELIAFIDKKLSQLR